MRYIYAALAAILMTGCASSSKTAAGPGGAAAQPTQPQTSVQPVPQVAVAEPPANGPEIHAEASLTKAQAEGTDTLIAQSSNLKTSHQGADPVQCLMAWIEHNQKNNPYLKTCEVSPPEN